jgi:Peptidase inhibitor family I36
MVSKQAILVACAATIALSSPAFAQRWGRSGFPREGVCFFKDPNFQGDYFCARAGENSGSVPDGMNDEISSVRVFGDAEVEVFKDIRFDGRSSRFGYDVRNLKSEGWNDLISSFRVVRRTSGGGGFGRPSGGFGRPRPTEDPERIVRRAYQDVFDREPDAQGMRLYRSRIIDDGWSEEQVRDALRRSPEYRERSTMTYARAQDIVRRAYLSVLKREPDAAGSQGYVNRVIRDHWSQQDVERELRKSSEYRNKG